MTSKPTLALRRKFQKHSAAVGIVGLGYVGLPMAELAARKGFLVIGVDTDARRAATINRGDSYIPDVPPDAIQKLVEAGKLKATDDYLLLRDVDVVIITVPTPLNKTGDPDMGYILRAIDSLGPQLHPGMLVILESTTYPGTTKELFEPMVSDAGLKVGDDVFVAFSPERIDPGNKVYGPENTPKVVGGITPECTDVACAFYRELVTEVVPVTSSTEAELVKIFENSFRSINIGLANELAIICHLLKVDVWEVIEAAGTKPFGFMPFYPGPGLGGHCIPIDPNYLSWKMRTLKYKTRFIELATEVNTQMPVWVVNRTMELLNEEGKSLKGAKILLLGVAYKADINDIRESPVLDIYSLLVRHGADIQYHDPHCPQIDIEGRSISSKPLTADLIARQDLVIIGTGHRKVDYKMVLSNATLVFDTRNVTRGVIDKPRARVEYL
jgi:UDP-N-acetyl-D-glucosamine dehydrogenase